MRKNLNRRNERQQSYPTIDGRAVDSPGLDIGLLQPILNIHGNELWSVVEADELRLAVFHKQQI